MGTVPILLRVCACELPDRQPHERDSAEEHSGKRKGGGEDIRAAIFINGIELSASGSTKQDEEA